MIRLNNTQYFHFLQQADALRRSGSLCDAIISVKSQTFHAHRLVLACASRTLAQQLSQGDTDSPVHCTIEYFSPHTFQQVLDFTYTQALEVSAEDLHQLLRAAQLLEMQPLEEQCRTQLDTLNYRCKEEESERENIHVEESKESVKETNQKRKGNLMEEEKLQEADDTGDCIVMESFSPPAPTKNNNSPDSRKKQRLSPTSATACSRDSVISKPATSSRSFFSPWTFPSSMWNPVSTLRRIAENYPTLIATHPLQSPNQSTVTYPFALSGHHTFPLFYSPFQSPAHGSVMGYSGFHPCYAQSPYTGSTAMGNMTKQGLLRRKKSNQRALTETIQTCKTSDLHVNKSTTDTVKVCQHCSTRLFDNPVLHESASTRTGESCTKCRFCGKDQVQHRQDPRGEKPYQCQHCPKKFSLKHQLDTHHRVHTGEKPFECRLCGQRSRDYSAMIKHLRTHGGAAPYRCTVCMEYCSSLVAMQRHIKSHSVQDFPPDWSISSTYLYMSHV